MFFTHESIPIQPLHSFINRFLDPSGIVCCLQMHKRWVQSTSGQILKGLMKNGGVRCTNECQTVTVPEPGRMPAPHSSSKLSSKEPPCPGTWVRHLQLLWWAERQGQMATWTGTGLRCSVQGCTPLQNSISGLPWSDRYSGDLVWTGNIRRDQQKVIDENS